MKILSSQEAKEKLKTIEGWQVKGKKIQKIYKFRKYMDGIKFINKLAELAEKEQHHPDIIIVWTTITVELTTHDAGGLTLYDIRMAKKINEVS
ncbi:MAG: 4a-hydroxytetrahydrobiopterin dehydratase [Thaumarchaeota archaeon]|nr:4a-hydroxytetrahydrobiopterin dehydratase [Nitrososphaerota archaeon]